MITKRKYAILLIIGLEKTVEILLEITVEKVSNNILYHSVAEN